MTAQLTSTKVEYDQVLDCDVVVVGSGAGGATTAAALAEQGVDVVMLEEGPLRRTGDFHTRVGESLRTLYRDAGASTTLGSPTVVFSEGRCVGGSTVINGGMCFRPPDRVLTSWSEEHAVIDAASDRLAPYFERAERALNVATQDPASIGRDQHLFRQGAERLGWSVVENTRNQHHCVGSNNCAFGCPTGAKQSMLVTALPRFSAAGGRLISDCKVTRISRRGKRAVGVRASVADPGTGREHCLVVRSAVVVVSAGAIQSPALVARSGFGSHSGRLGRNLSLHPNAKVVAVFDEEVRGWEGVHQAFQVREFLEDGILLASVNLPPALVAMGLSNIGTRLGEAMAEYSRMLVTGCLVEDAATGRVWSPPRGGPPVVRYRPTDRDLANVQRGVLCAAELAFAAGARRVLSPFRGQPDLRSMDDVRRLTDYRVSRSAVDLFTVHVMGTLAMGENRTRSVVSSYGMLHDAAGLMVSDASLFPTPLGVNPMETIVALALRNADALLAERSSHGF